MEWQEHYLHDPQLLDPTNIGIIFGAELFNDSVSTLQDTQSRMKWEDDYDYEWWVVNYSKIYCRGLFEGNIREFAKKTKESHKQFLLK